jgi:hypothetical protein
LAEDLPSEVRSKDGKGVDLYELLTYTIGAIKAQQEQIRKQAAQLDVLATRLDQGECEGIRTTGIRNTYRSVSPDPL